MRKADYLRGEFNKLLKKHGEEGARKKIYGIHLPSWFRKTGDCAEPTCVPVSDDRGVLVGIAAEHPYEYGEDIFTYTENFVLR